MLESARGRVPNLAEIVVGRRIQGSWWGHPQGKEIFWLTRAVREAPDVLVCRLVDGKITYVHRRLWPALLRLAPRFARRHLAAVREVHAAQGRHEVRMVPFPRWAPASIRRAARRLSAEKAEAALGMILGGRSLTRA